jgi:hypothetical protein
MRTGLFRVRCIMRLPAPHRYSASAGPKWLNRSPLLTLPTVSAFTLVFVTATIRERSARNVAPQDMHGGKSRPWSAPI